MEKVDFSKNPYKGVFAMVARARGVTRQTVHEMYYKQNPLYVMLVNARLRHINKMLGKAQ